MKRIINGRKYDTEKAFLVGSSNNGLPANDFGWYGEELYRKRNNEYFLYGEGGPASKYAESCGRNQWCGGEKIVPLSDDEARKWAEENFTVEEYEYEFGEVDDGDVAMTEYEVAKEVLREMLYAEQEDWEKALYECRDISCDPESDDNELRLAIDERRYHAIRRNLLAMIVNRLDDYVEDKIHGVDPTSGKVA